MTIQRLFHDPILLILIIASLVSWVIIIDRCVALYRSAKAEKAFPQAESSLKELARVLQQFHGVGREEVLTIMDTAIAQQRQRLERSLPILGVIGNTAAYAGLLGTVIGILQSFQEIQSHNNMSPAVVSGGIASALIATAVGLAVAIPAVAAHYLLCAAIAKRVTQWEAIVATWLPNGIALQEEDSHEPISLG